jgi:hypothetical protein
MNPIDKERLSPGEYVSESSAMDPGTALRLFSRPILAFDQSMMDSGKEKEVAEVAEPSLLDEMEEWIRVLDSLENDEDARYVGKLLDRIIAANFTKKAIECSYLGRKERHPSFGGRPLTNKEKLEIQLTARNEGKPVPSMEELEVIRKIENDAAMDGMAVQTSSKKPPTMYFTVTQEYRDSLLATGPFSFMSTWDFVVQEFIQRSSRGMVSCKEEPMMRNELIALLHGQKRKIQECVDFAK